MKKVAFYTLGCKLNYSETSTISRMFESNGYQKVDFHEQPDIFVINTCSVTEHADKKCRKIVKEAKIISPQSSVFVIGCYAQLKPQEIAEIEGVDAVLGAAEKFRLVEVLKEYEKQTIPKIQVGNINQPLQFEHSYSAQDRTRTFLKVQDGCNYNCSFCTIPLARGTSRSDTIESIVESSIAIAKKGIKEIVLTGVNIGDFGIQNGRRKERFLDLIKELDQVQGIERFRISSIEPNLLTKEIIEFVAGSKRFVPHFHIPLQSGSDEILKSMRRRYDSTSYRNKIELINKTIPECCIGVDVITGYPGETENIFLETYHFLNELEIAYLHVFTYSERANTHAINLLDVVPKNIRQARTTQLRTLSEKKRRVYNQQFEGRNAKVLFENEIDTNGNMMGYTENYIRVVAKFDPLLVNEIKFLKLVEQTPDGLMLAEEPTEVLSH